MHLNLPNQPFELSTQKQGMLGKFEYLKNLKLAAVYE